MKELQRLYGDLGIVQGEIGEDLFYRNVEQLFENLGLDINKVQRNVLVKGLAEYDIVAENASRVIVIEVKNKLYRKHVDEFMKKKLMRFKTLKPEYQNHELLGGVGGLVVKDDVGNYAEKAGLFVLTQTADGGASLLNRPNFEPRVFLPV